MRHRWPLAVVVLLVAATACGGDTEQAADPEPQPTVTVTVTASPEPEEPGDDGEDEPDDVQDDPCADPPEGRDLIFVTQPSSGTRVSSPFTVSGCSSTFEANVVWELLDGDGGVLAEGFTMGGTMGEPDGFTFDVEYEVDEEQIGSLRVFETSAEDGSEIHVNEMPLVLAP